MEGFNRALKQRIYGALERIYAPVTVLIDERTYAVHLSHDRMVSFLALYRNSEALAVARDLDSKIETLLRESAA